MPYVGEYTDECRCVGFETCGACQPDKDFVYNLDNMYIAWYNDRGLSKSKVYSSIEDVKKYTEQKGRLAITIATANRFKYRENL